MTNRIRSAVAQFSATLLPLLCLSVAAQTDSRVANENDDEDVIVVPIEVEAPQIESRSGHTIYSNERISQTPTGERTIAELLRLNPAVEFSRNSELSAGSATLRPAEISIHGEQFYQNLFLIDGTDTTNDINPAASEDLWSTPSLVAPIGGSSPQGYYIDVALIDRIEVFDSNIPVEYGGFTGGVVAVETKEYTDFNRYSVNFGLQKSEWENFHLSEDDITSADRFRAVYTPDYTKSNFGFSVLQSLNDDTGVFFGINRRTSTFGQQYEDDADILRMIDYEDHIDNVMGGINTKIDDIDVGVSFRYATRAHDGLTSTTYTGAFSKEHSGRGVSVSLGRSLTIGELEANISYDVLSDILDSAHSWFTYHEYLEGSGMSRFEGAFGDTNQEQSRFSVNPKLVLNPRPLGEFVHTVTLGGQFRSTSSFYERPETIVYEQYFCIRDMGREGCRDQDGDGVSSAGDEYLNRRWFYQEGSVDLDYNQIAFYAQTNMERDRLEFTLGIRTDWDSFLENFDISPRVSGSFTPDSESARKFEAGVSRYYGRSFLRYQLNDAIYGWRESYTNLTRPRGRAGEEVPCSVPDWTNCTHLTYDNRTGISDISTPYADEFMLGWIDELGVFETKLKYVKRNSRDGVSRERDEDRLYYYANGGRSTSDSVLFDVTHHKLLELGNTSTQFFAGLSFSERSSNRQNDSGYDEQIDTDLVYYDGELISFDELPPWDYNIPVGVRVSSITKISRPNITWSNFYNYRQGGTIARDSRENYTSPDTGAEYDIYRDFDFDSLFTINSKIVWVQALREGQEAYVELNIHNLFDKITDRSLFETRKRYTEGRRVWFEVGYRYTDFLAGE